MRRINELWSGDPSPNRGQCHVLAECTNAPFGSSQSGSRASRKNPMPGSRRSSSSEAGSIQSYATTLQFRKSQISNALAESAATKSTHVIRVRGTILYVLVKVLGH